MRLSSNDELTLLDILSILSFLIGIQNLDYNITQEDMDNTTRKLDNALHKEVDDIHAHLQKQDNKIDEIKEIVYEIYKKVSEYDR